MEEAKKVAVAKYGWIAIGWRARHLLQLKVSLVEAQRKRRRQEKRGSGSEHRAPGAALDSRGG